MNKIKLAKGFFIEIDNLNYTLKKVVVVETGKNAGKKKGKAIGYYGDFKGAIQGFLKHYAIEYGDKKLNGLEEYVEMIERLNNKAVKQIFKRWDKEKN